jgi:hypothetical protein
VTHFLSIHSNSISGDDSRWSSKFVTDDTPAFISLPSHFTPIVNLQSHRSSNSLCSEKKIAMATNVFDHGPDHVSLQDNSLRAYTSELSAFGPQTGRSQLGVDFQPSDLSVICGRGKDSYNHAGNRCFRILASVFVERYSRADSRTAKSALVLIIVSMIRQVGGHFCKYEKGAWFEVGDRCAREKVSAYLRDMLYSQYRSSAKSKIILRRDRNRNKRKMQMQIQQHSQQQLVDSAGGDHSDDSSMSSSCWGSSLEFMGFGNLLDDDFFDIEVF